MPRKRSDTPQIADLQKRLIQCLEAAQELENALPDVETKYDLSETCALFADLRAVQDRLDTLSKKLVAVSDRLSYELVPDMFKRWRTVSPYKHLRGTFTLATRTNCKLLDKPGCFAWLRANDLGGLIQEHVPWQTMGAAAAERISEGKELPTNLFETTTRLYTRLTIPKAEKMHAYSETRSNAA